MTYQVLSTLKVKTRQGETILSPGQIINLNPSKADSLLALGRIKPVEQKSMTTWPESLEEVLNAIVLASCNRIVETLKGKQYRANDEIRKAEEDVNHLYHEVLNGLAEYQAACQRWERLFICGD
jgi:hypothetical protein